MFRRTHMKSSARISRSQFRNFNGNSLPPLWKKLDILGKLVIGIFGIVFAYLLHTNQIKLTGEINKTTREFEKTRIMISQGQLASTLIENIITGNEKEKNLALAILESTAKDMYPQLLYALSLGAPDESTRNKAARGLNDIKSQVLKTAKAFYDSRLYQSAADEFKKIEDLLTDSEVNRAELALAKSAYQARDYKLAAEQYIKAIKMFH